MRTAREEQCRKLGLPTPGEAQTTEVVRLRGEMHELQKALQHTQAALVGRGLALIGRDSSLSNRTHA